MKNTKLGLSVLSILIVLAFTLSYAEEEKAYVPKDDEEIYGTWVNTDYSGGAHQYQKMVNHPDGRHEVFAKVTDEKPSYRGTYTLINKWTDSERNIWYKMHWKESGSYFGYDLDKISDSANTWEYVTSRRDYPAEMDPNHPRYHIYYRK